MKTPRTRNRAATALATLILGLAANVAVAGSDERTESSADRPNILFIITDDQKRDELGYLGGSGLTPNVDRLAHEGLRFNRLYVATSVCTPSRYTCLTGQYASRVTTEFFNQHTTSEGVTRVVWNSGFVEGQPNLPKVLRDAGYQTGFVGKWHVGGMDNIKVVPPGADPADPEVRAAFEHNQASGARKLGEYGFEFARNIYMGNPNDDRSLVNTGMNVHNMEWLTQAGLEFIDENHDRPFFLYFSPTLTHVPPPEDSLKGDPRASGVGLLDAPIEGIQPSRESVMARCREAGLPEELWGSTWLDDGIGALIDRLEEYGILENTLIVHFVDHGMESQSKGTCYQGGLVSPAFVYWKGRIEPGEYDGMLQNTDFAPTFLDVAGIEPPADMVIDGKSFAPLFEDAPYEARESVYSEIGIVRAVSTPEWKYIAFHVPPSLAAEAGPDERWYQMGMAAGGHRFERGQYDSGGAWKPNYFDADQLYHLAEDPLETTNLADDPEFADKLAEMKALLAGHLAGLPGTYPGFNDAAVP
jgi:arylsulfatase A-like enzyme